MDVRSGLILGLCLPASCTRQSIVTLLQEMLNMTELTEKNLHCSNDRLNEPNSNLRGTIAFIVIISLLTLIVLMGTMIDIVAYIHFYMNNESKTTSITSYSQSLAILIQNRPFVEFFGEFSAIRTLQRIFVITKSENDNMFTCLNGIRVLSLIWIILGHSFSSGIYYTSNMKDMQAARRNIFIHVLLSGGFAVDTFFIMSGFLTAILFVRQTKKERVSLRMMSLYYIHRYIRLTPSFILVMFVSIYLTPYFGHGPLYPIQQGFEPENCRKGNWWTAFLYIGNFLKSEDLCNGITWYLYNDMQFYWVAPLALIPFVKGKKNIGYMMIVVFLLINFGSVLGILLYYPSLVNPEIAVANNLVSQSRVFLF